MKYFAASILLIGLSLGAPAIASEPSWGATTEPSSAPDGTPYCMLWYGSEAPMMNLIATAKRTQINVVADKMEPIKLAAPAMLRFGSGRELAILPVVKPAPNLARATIRAADVSTVVAEIALGGSFTFSSNENTVTFPVKSAADKASGFLNCLDKL